MRGFYCETCLPNGAGPCFLNGEMRVFCHMRSGRKGSLVLKVYFKFVLFLNVLCFDSCKGIKGIRFTRSYMKILGLLRFSENW